MLTDVAIHKTLSSILQLGNINFVQDKTSDQATLPDNTGMVMVMVINGDLSSDALHCDVYHFHFKARLHCLDNGYDIDRCLSVSHM